MSAPRRSTSRCSTPTTTSTRPRRRSRSSSPTATRAHRLRRRAGPHEDRRAGQISDYIPNPTFEVVARPGAQEDYFRDGNPEGKSRREIFGEPMRAIPAFREPAPRRADGRAGHRPGPDVPHAGQPRRGADAGRPRADPRRDPRPQRVDARDLAVRLRGPHLRHAGDHPADRREGHRGARVGGRAGAKAVLIRPAPVPGYRGPGRSACPSSTPSGRRWSSTTSSWPCTRPTAATSATPTTGWAATARCSRSSPRRSACCRVAPDRGRGRRHDLPRRPVPLPRSSRWR